MEFQAPSFALAQIVLSLKILLQCLWFKFKGKSVPIFEKQYGPIQKESLSFETAIIEVKVSFHGFEQLEPTFC